MKQIVTQAIVLTRIDYGEADRILTLLTPDQGKLRLMAKGVRRIKSKLAGGIELFSVSAITFMRGRGDIGTLVSARLAKHYGHIVEDLDRTMLGYELIKELHKITEDEPEPAYFELLQQAFEALDDADISIELIRFWFAAQLLRLAGHTPNFQTDTSDQKLQPGTAYHFDFDSMSFNPSPDGQIGTDHIKFLRLAFSRYPAKVLANVQGSQKLVSDCSPLITRVARER